MIFERFEPQQALAVFELLDDLRECIWNHCATEIRELVKDQQAPDEKDQPEQSG